MTSADGPGGERGASPPVVKRGYLDILCPYCGRSFNTAFGVILTLRNLRDLPAAELFFAFALAVVVWEISLLVISRVLRIFF